ncbi:MAG TPA: hypothetical protein VMZ03_06900, partial [Chitinophagaceae bacterium]|nr:hypothetical protein [Chitinophagaceae bacterium]
MTNPFLDRKIFYAAAFVTGCCFLLGCENDAGRVTDWTKKVVMTEEAIDVDSYLSQNGKMKAR